MITHSPLSTAGRRSRMTLAALLVALPAVAAPPTAGAQVAEHWAGTWAAGLQAQAPPRPAAASPDPRPGEDLFGPLAHVHNQTLRQIVRATIGGSRLRVAFTNVFGTQPLEIGAAHVAVRAAGAAIEPEAGAPLRFGGRPSVTIQAGSTVLSDAVDLEVPALGHLAVDLYLPGDNRASGSPASTLRGAWTTSYVSPTGNHSGAEEMPVEATLQSWLYLSRVEVAASTAIRVVVMLGDSITEGFGSTADADRRWPDVLAERLTALRSTRGHCQHGDQEQRRRRSRLQRQVHEGILSEVT